MPQPLKPGYYIDTDASDDAVDRPEPLYGRDLRPLDTSDEAIKMRTNAAWRKQHGRGPLPAWPSRDIADH